MLGTLDHALTCARDWVANSTQGMKQSSLCYNFFNAEELDICDNHLVQAMRDEWYFTEVKGKAVLDAWPPGETEVERYKEFNISAQDTRFAAVVARFWERLATEYTMRAEDENTDQSHAALLRSLAQLIPVRRKHGLLPLPIVTPFFIGLLEGLFDEMTRSFTLVSKNLLY